MSVGLSLFVTFSLSSNVTIQSSIPLCNASEATILPWSLTITIQFIVFVIKSVTQCIVQSIQYVAVLASRL